MNKQEFYDMLNQGDLEVVFTKKTDGSTRVMKCTANAPEESALSNPRNTSPETLITVYDIEAKGWRSFYSDNIQSVKPLETRFGMLLEAA